MDKRYVIYMMEDIDNFGWIKAYGTDGIDCTKNYNNAKKMTEVEADDCVNVLNFIGVRDYRIFEW